MFADGKITPDTPYWKEGMAERMAIGRMEVLSTKFPPTSNPIVPPRRTVQVDDSSSNPDNSRNKVFEIKKRSAKNKILTAPTIFLLVGVFFIVLTAAIYLTERFTPDIAGQWRAETEQASRHR